MSSPKDIVTTPSGEKNITLPNGMTTVSPYFKKAPSPEVRTATSPSNINVAYDSTVKVTSTTTSTTAKRKQTSNDPQEESQESPKKRARTPTGFEFIRDTFGYTFHDLTLLKEALDTTGIYRPQSNQSLALIGDSILQTTIYRDWYPSKQLKGVFNQVHTDRHMPIYALLTRTISQAPATCSSRPSRATPTWQKLLSRSGLTRTS